MNAKVKAMVDGKKVMIFSKSYCPHCKKAKGVFELHYLKTGILKRDDYEVLELDEQKDGADIQAAAGKLSGSKTVPQVFVKGKHIGGGSETEAMHKKGELKKMLTT